MAWRNCDRKLIMVAAQTTLADSTLPGGLVSAAMPHRQFGTTTMGFAREVAELFLAGRRRTEVRLTLALILSFNLNLHESTLAQRSHALPR